MDIQILWCKYCGVRYESQRSGEGCFEEKSTWDHCAECSTVIKKALDQIPIKVVEKYIPCPDFGKDFKFMLEALFSRTKQTRTLWLYINGKMYLPVKIDYPHEFRKFTCYCADGEEVLCRAKIDKETNKILLYC